MANSSLRKASLQSMEAEIESLLKSLENLKDDASDESRKTLKSLKGNAENALRHSRSLLTDAYEEVKTKTRETGIATRDYAQQHPWTTAGVACWPPTCCASAATKAPAAPVRRATSAPAARRARPRRAGAPTGPMTPA